MGVISTGLAFLCLVAASPSCCYGFVYSPVTRLIQRSIVGAPPTSHEVRYDEYGLSLFGC